MSYKSWSTYFICPTIYRKLPKTGLCGKRCGVDHMEIRGGLEFPKASILYFDTLDNFVEPACGHVQGTNIGVGCYDNPLLHSNNLTRMGRCLIARSVP